MRRAVLVFAALLLASAFAMPSRAQTTAIEKPNINIATASLGLTYLPLIIAKQRKYFDEEGLKVEISAFAGGSKALQSLMGGSSDVASGAYSNTLTMAAKNQKLQNFVVQVRNPGFVIGVSTRLKDKVKSFADLKGLKVGVSAPGSSTHMVVAYLLNKAGLKPQDISAIGVGTSAAAVAAMKTGEIDVICNNDPVMTILESSGDVFSLAEMRTEKGSQSAFGGNYPEASLYATADFVAKHPHTIQALTNAVVRAELWLQKATKDDVAANVPPEFIVGDKELYLASFEKMRTALSPDGRLDPKGAKIVYDVLADFLPEVKAAHFKLEDTYDNRFVEAALKKYQ